MIVMKRMCENTKGDAFMQTALLLCDIATAIIGFLFAYRILFCIVGMFKTKRFAPAQKQHRYAVVVAARNEAAVIGNLLKSIAEQDYPAELLTVFVVADNCTDRTAEIARAYGAYCYERWDDRHCTKGYALEFLFDRIEEDFGRDRFEGYFLFDADNLLARDFVSRMNDAFDSGNKVIVSYRNTKNFGDGWLAAGYAMHWIRTCRMEHCARSFFGVSARIQGTGVLFSNQYVANGWHYTSLTEDRAFSSAVLVAGDSITYQHEAQFFDEQPTSFRIAWRQRLRWAKGNLQAFTETRAALFRGMFRQKTFQQRLSCYDMLLFNFPSSIITVPLKALKAVLTVAAFIMGAQGSAQWVSFLRHLLNICLLEHLWVIPLGLLLCALEHRRMPPLKWYRYLGYSLMFPLFGIIGDLTMLIAVFKKVSWEPIPHRVSVDIDQMQGADFLRKKAVRLPQKKKQHPKRPNRIASKNKKERG